MQSGSHLGVPNGPCATLVLLQGAPPWWRVEPMEAGKNGANRGYFLHLKTEVENSRIASYSASII
jgi:hypothetical protein